MSADRQRERMSPPSLDLRDPAGWPSGHLGWAFPRRASFEGRAMTFLAAGARRGEKLVYVADDPRPGQWPPELLERGHLVVASTREVYGDARRVEAELQRATFEGMLAAALSDGYTGIRVAADNTSLIEGAERLEAWLAWEAVADDFMAHHPVTGLCGFDRTRVDDGVLEHVMGRHDRVIGG